MRTYESVLFSMVVQYCQRYTDREDGKNTQLRSVQLVWFVERIYGSYAPYELKMASRIVRTVVRFVKRIYGS